jgi:hypothetical protein
VLCIDREDRQSGRRWESELFTHEIRKMVGLSREMLILGWRFDTDLRDFDRVFNPFVESCISVE